MKCIKTKRNFTKFLRLENNLKPFLTYFEVIFVYNSLNRHKIKRGNILNKFKTIIKLDIVKAIVVALFSTLCFCFCVEIVRCNGIYEAFYWLADHKRAFMFGAAAIFLVCFAIVWATRRSIFVITIGLALFLASFVNFYKLTYRGDPLLPIDFVIALDAAKVAGGLYMPFTPPMWLFLGVLAVLAIVLWQVRLTGAKTRKRAVINTAASLGVVPVLLLYFSCIIWNENITLSAGIKTVPSNAAMSYETSGFVTGYLMYLNNLSPQMPKGYSQQAMLEAKQKLKEPIVKDKPDIIVVMLESYYHLTNYPKAEIQNITSNFTRLQTEGVGGYYLSDKYSGGTGDMEFGALTGYSTSFLPTGSIPYSQYVSVNEIPAYPKFLKSKGYSTAAIHPYDGTIYKRNKAYPNMGIDNFITQEQFDKNQTKGMYISDKAVMDKIIETYENNIKAGPVFIHAVTMQNHIPNEAKEYGADEVKASYPGAPDELNASFASVATGLNDADAAMGYLTDYLRKSNRPCVVLFFGDHQTSIGSLNGKELLDYTNTIDNLPQEAKVLATHKAPYLMWANFDTGNEGKGGDFLPPYMLLAKTAQLYNLPRPAWFQWLADTQQELGGINLGYKITKDGGLEQNFSKKQEEILNIQRLLQYDGLFGKKFAYQSS